MTERLPETRQYFCEGLNVPIDDLFLAAASVKVDAESIDEYLYSLETDSPAMFKYILEVSAKIENASPFKDLDEIEYLQNSYVAGATLIFETLSRISEDRNKILVDPDVESFVNDQESVPLILNEKTVGIDLSRSATKLKSEYPHIFDTAIELVARLESRKVEDVFVHLYRRVDAGLDVSKVLTTAVFLSGVSDVVMSLERNAEIEYLNYNYDF